MAEVGQTRIRPALARLLTAVFLFSIAIVPCVQQVADIRAYMAGHRSSPVPRCYDIFRKPPGVGEALTRAGLSPRMRIVEANRLLMRAMHAYEDQLENDSIIGGLVRAPTQYVLARWLGAGNDKAYCGVRPWLFYRTDIEYLTGPGFLDPVQLARRAAAGTEWKSASQPDPRPAILDFHRQLEARGIQLIVMPVPPKPAVHPDKFTSRFNSDTVVLQNQSYADFIRGLKEDGVRVVDVMPVLAGVAQGCKAEENAYLVADTHWRPESMERVARFLKQSIVSNILLPPRPEAGYHAQAVEVTNRGDIAVMLRLPDWARGYPPEAVCLRRIQTARGETWQADEASDVLVMGDSFCNIYSLDAMGWGESAGLIEQLSFELHRPLDRLVINDNGAYATRALLARELARGRDRLAGKRLVIWQFAMRDLAAGDWKSEKLTLGKPAPGLFAVPVPGQDWNVRGMVRAIAPMPWPGTVPYKDHVVAMHIVDLETGQPAIRGNQALVYSSSMRDNVRTPVARLRPGDSVTMRLRPWSDVAPKYERINRTELPDEALQLAEPCWGEFMPPAGL